MPVESTRRSKPALLREYGIRTFKSCCRLHRVLKSETGHARPHSFSIGFTQPVVCTWAARALMSLPALMTVVPWVLICVPTS